jgi:hypothetical protein
MNGTPSGPTGFDRAELDRLLPDPARRELPADRHNVLRERFMHQIREPAPATPQARRGLLLPALLGAGLAVALGAGAVTGVFSPSRPPAATAPKSEAAALLDRIALAAERKPAPSVRDDQFSYCEIVRDGSNGPSRDQAWRSVDGSKVGLSRSGASRTQKATQQELGPIAQPWLARPTYKFLAGLPTDPDKLAELIRKDAKRTQEEDRKTYHGSPGPDTPIDFAMMRVIAGIMRDCNVPPAVRGALYKAVAKVSGVTVVQDVVDADGRHGVGLSFTSFNWRTTWIFDRDTLALLGARDEYTYDSMTFTTPDHVYVSAIVAAGFVDKVGDTVK